MMIGGAEEIGANSCYLDLDGTGVLIDAGLHPRDRSIRAFPDVDALGDRPTDALIVTHAHTDHLGGLPYVMRRKPHLRAIMSDATRDLSHVMLHNNAKLLKSDVTGHFSEDALLFYKRDQIELLRHAFEAIPYQEPLSMRGYTGRSDVRVTLHPAGHILGSAAVGIECGGYSILHTGDIQFDDQAVIPRARVPRGHVDCLITEATNAMREDPNDFKAERKRLAGFINTVTTNNGSVLIPCFALGKQQEILMTIHSLMRAGSIPPLPVYTGGMGRSISKIYDQYCYTEPMKQPGFEISDIPQERVTLDTAFTEKYFKTPSIVIVPSGMMNMGTLSYALATAWMTRPSFGIAVIGYQDPATPGAQLMASVPGKSFEFGTRTMKRSCAIERFRFSAHASLDGLLDLITDVKPTTLCIVHGETQACDHLALCAKERLPATRVIVPRHGQPYSLC
jgi:Cft2 family RNA processing exonuclease